jgi:hypothetical protein
LLAASGLSDLRTMTTRWFGKRAGLVGAATLAVVIVGTQIWHGFNRLLAYRIDGLVEALAPDDKMLGDWLARCVSTDSRILAAPYSYVPPQFDRLLVSESQQQLVAFNPDVVIFSKDDMAFWQRSAERLATDPYTGDTRSILAFFDEITRSPKWEIGPNFVRYQVYVSSTSRAAVRAGCR